MVQVSGPVVQVQLCCASFASTAVAMYWAMPWPTEAGAVQLTTVLASATVACTLVGLPGRPAVGRTRADGALAGELTSVPTAVTVTVYNVRFVRPVMMHSVSV